MNTVVVTGLPRTVTLLDRLGDRARHLRPVLLGDVTNAVHEFFAEQFASEGAAGGERWAPLSPVTRRIKARYGRAGYGALQFTRTLWASLTKRSHPLGRRLVTDTTLEIGTNDPKAIKHQLGIGVPRRPIAPDVMPAVQLARWDSLIAAYLTGADDAR